MTTFGIGGSAGYFAELDSKEILEGLFKWSRKENVPVFAIGGGSNIVVADEGIEALVLKLSSNGSFGKIDFTVEDDKHIAVVGPAVPSAVLLRRTAEAGFSGLEFFAGIPGTVGGAVACDAGGRFGRISSALVGYEGFPYAFGKQDKGAYWLDKTRDAEDFLITEVVLKIEPAETAVVNTRIQEILDYRRKTQPEGVKSAGCIFQNPPDGPSAGELIDKAGLKGKRRGGAEVSTVHANYIINSSGATAFDVIGLALDIIEVVQEKTGVKLALKVDIWGESLEELISRRGYF